MEEDLNAALDGILLGDLSEAEGKEEDIDSMTAKLGGQGGQTEASGRRRETGGVVIIVFVLVGGGGISTV